MPTTVSLKKIVGEIDLLLNEEWTAYLNRRTGELYTVTVEQADAVDDPDNPYLEDWQREDLPKVREILESADWLALPTKFDLRCREMKQVCYDPIFRGCHSRKRFGL